MKRIAQFVGLDVHKDTVCMAVAFGGPGLAVRELGVVPHDVPKVVQRILELGPAECLQVAYEAGPTGYGLCRALEAVGVRCIVAAPSKTPVRSGDRIKTDRRDAAKLARFLRSGELVAVALPERETEALRDVVRAREDVVHAQRRARQQLSAFLLRHDRKWTGKSSWTEAHLAWIQSQIFESEAQTQVLEDYVAEVRRLTARLAQGTGCVEHFAEAFESCRPLYRALQALRGVGPIVAATVVAEVADLRRFRSAAQFMSYLGLTPSERSSGPRTFRGSITKAGNPHVRWKLIESAWSYRHRPAQTVALERRCKDLPQGVRDIAWKAQKRLHKRYWAMTARGKRVQTVVVALARELAGFIWAVGQVVPRPAR
ncbi:MAG: IS110 family transposase [Longimicrobiales bacterium]